MAFNVKWSFSMVTSGLRWSVMLITSFSFSCLLHIEYFFFIGLERSKHFCCNSCALWILEEWWWYTIHSSSFIGYINLVCRNGHMWLDASFSTGGIGFLLLHRWCSEMVKVWTLFSRIWFSVKKFHWTIIISLPPDNLPWQYEITYALEVSLIAPSILRISKKIMMVLGSLSVAVEDNEE